MDNATLEAIVEQGKALNDRVDSLTQQISSGRVAHLDLVPEWAHDAIEAWTDGRPSVSLRFINHVNSAVRVFYSVERKARQQEGWSRS